MRIGIDARKIGDFGIGTYIRGLLGGLARYADEEDYVVLAPAAARPLIPRRFEHVVLDAPHYSIRELFLVGQAVRRAAIDLLHAPHYVIPLTRRPVVVTIHDLIHLHQRHGNPFASLYARTMLARAVRRSAHILTVTEAVKREIVARFGCPASKVTVTPNGVDERFRAAGPNAHPSPYFLYAGNDKPHKNVDRLVEAFALVRGRRGETALVLAGSRFERHQGRDGVITPGFVDETELASLYRGALALVQPSIEEGFGLPAAEAMASGVAVITSTAPALVEITGDAALHADAFSIESLAEAMLRIAGDDELRLLLARRGMERARSMTWDRCAESTRGVYLAM
ncbi:MAG TPA: glycosyltransferase family 1 protein [Thermoanaerobaculia bacterium]|nr:glycosyltransferase family 1 protein [Thermoanaerobaculia bacterium]